MPFAVLRPKTTEEALKLMSDNRGEIWPLAGGTNVMVEIRHGKKAPVALLDLSGVREFDYIRRREGVWEIGPLATHARLGDHPDLAGGPLRALALAASTVGGVQIRNRGTLAGNVQNASPAADAALALLTLDARVRLASCRGEREVPIAGYFTGPGRTVKEPDELIVGILIPDPSPEARSTFLKLGKRNALAISVVSVAAFLEVGPDGAVSCCRVALGAVAPVPVRAVSVERNLEGRVLNGVSILKAVKAVPADISPISDIRATAEYRVHCARVLVARALGELSGSRGGVPGDHGRSEPDR